MTATNNKITAYLAHPIRGLRQELATPEEINMNNQQAHEVAEHIRRQFSFLYIYVPGEHDEFPQTGYEECILSIQDILDIDIQIMLRKDIVLVWWPYMTSLQGGVKGEYDCAIEAGKPVLKFCLISHLNHVTERMIRTLAQTPGDYSVANLSYFEQS